MRRLPPIARAGPRPAELRSHPSALRAWELRRRALSRRIFRPAPRLTLSEWAERHRRLSRETSAEPGPWRNDRVPYLVEIMDAISDPTVGRMVVMKAARVGYTEGVIGNAIGYIIDQDPCPIIAVQPSEGDAEDWSKTQLAPMLRDTPCLAGKVAEPRSRDSGNTILGKLFPGGSLTIVGATSPKGLRRRTARVVLFDEVDAYPASAGAEGDPVRLGEKRTTTFPDRKIVIGSTPTVKGISRIEREYALTDRREYFVPCPHCGHEQVLRWGGPDEPYGIKWDREERDAEVVHLPETAYYLCEGCGAAIEERDKAEMVRRGRWVATNPGASVPGWHVTALMSLFDGASWANLVREWLDAQEDAEQLQVFVNTVLAETWEERGETFSPAGLASRAEAYTDAQGKPVDVPHGVAVLTAGVDIQADRLELEVDGWGRGEESWLITHQRIYGDPHAESTWARLEAFLTKPYRHAGGKELRIAACMIDSGFATQAVYAFVRPRQGRNVWAAKGDNGRKGRPPLSRASRANRDGVKLFTIGTFAMKDWLFSRLKVGRPGPGYMHFCEPTETGADAEYFAQFAAEKKVRRRKRGSRTQFVEEYVQVRKRNEAIDLKVLAYAALHALGPAVREHLGELAAQMSGEKPAVQPKRRRVRSKGVVV